MKKLLYLLILLISLSTFAQSDYYYYKGKRIPLIVNQTKVNVISLANGPQFAPSTNPNTLPAGLEIDAIISDAPYNMCIIKNNTQTQALLTDYINSIVNPLYNIVIPCYYSSNDLEYIITNKIYVKLRNLNQISTLQSMASTYNFNIISQDSNMPLWFTISITQQSAYNALEMANILYETGIFLAAEPEFINNEIENISWDEKVDEQWGLYNTTNDTIDINASSAWNYSTGRGIKIAVIDTGVEHTHIDLINNIDPYCYDTHTGTNNHSIRGSTRHHGTHIAGIIAAERNNGICISGVAPDSKLISICIDLGVSATGDKISDGIFKAVTNNADILNCSWGGGGSNKITDAIDYAIDYGRNGKGCIVVKSAGNSGDSITFPGNHRPEILVVGSLQKNGFKKNTSCFGYNLDVVAPGDNILSTRLNVIPWISAPGHHMQHHTYPA